MKNALHEIDQDEMSQQRQALAKRLRERRIYLGFTQDEVAKALGVMRPVVSNIEACTRKVEAIELEQLARLYSTSVQELMHGQSQEGLTESLNPEMLQGLSESDIAEINRFAQFLRSKPKE